MNTLFSDVFPFTIGIKKLKLVLYFIKRAFS
nr:MAG TPA: hypothetical protein [Crassvirales sp.]